MEEALKIVQEVDPEYKEYLAQKAKDEKSAQIQEQAEAIQKALGTTFASIVGSFTLGNSGAPPKTEPQGTQSNASGPGYPPNCPSTCFDLCSSPFARGGVRSHFHPD